MHDFLLQNYLWLKALHVISVMAWMAGLLYLPRLFAYHAESKVGSEQSETFKTMESRLLRIIMNPAMIAAWLFGILMITANPSLFEHGWMHVKFMLVIIMSILHMVFSKWRKNFAVDKNVKSAKFYKLWNEAPAAIMVIIVIMAVAEPF